MSVTAHEIREALHDETLRGMRVLLLGLVLGVVLFSGVTWFRATPAPEDGGVRAQSEGIPLRTLSLANAGLLAVALVGGRFLFRARLAPASSDTAAARVEALRGAYLLQWALLEAAAVFGVAVCFLATRAGPPPDPAVWWNLISPTVFVLFAAANFPTRERIVALLSESR